MTDDIEKCSNCKYVRTVGTKWICKRYPPTVYQSQYYEENAEQPYVDHDDWCGEFQIGIFAAS